MEDRHADIHIDDQLPPRNPLSGRLLSAVSARERAKESRVEIKEILSPPLASNISLSLSEAPLGDHVTKLRACNRSLGTVRDRTLPSLDRARMDSS